MNTPERPMNEIFDMAVKLREIHATMKAFYGPDEFAAHVVAIEPELRRLAVVHDGSVTVAAIHALKTCDDSMTCSLILAVATEIMLRETNAQMTGDN